MSDQVESPPPEEAQRQFLSVRAWMLIFVALCGIYSIGATWDLRDQNVDAIAAAVPGWTLVNEGTLRIDGWEGQNPWFVPVQDGIVSNRPPGVIAAAAVGYALAAPFTPTLSGVPATAAALLATATAVVLMGRLIERTFGRRDAVVSVVALGLGAATWPISSSQLWPHGLDQLWLVLVVVALSRERLALAGSLLGMAILTRPPLAVVALVVGLVYGANRRSLRPLIAVGAPAIIGTALLILYNVQVFGSWSISGGYEGILDSSDYQTPSGYLANLFGTFFDSTSGVLVWSPWLLVLVPLMRKAWVTVPTWTRAAALAGLAYLLVHTALNRFWGGLAFNYRYAIEPITLAMPLLAATLVHLRGSSSLMNRLYWTALAVALLLQGTDAMLSRCVTVGETAACRLIGF